MIYTFENIANIKNLKYPGKPKEKHLKKISKIKDGLFKDYDYSNFKFMKRPSNESIQTFYELKTLKALPIDEKFVKEKDDIEKCFETVCINNGIEFPREFSELFQIY